MPERWHGGTPVLCLPGVGLIDEAAAIVLAQLIERRGVGARSEQAGAISMSKFFSIDMRGIEVICLCYLERASRAQVRYAVRRVRRASSDAVILIVSLRGDEDSEETLPGTRFVRGSFKAAVDHVVFLGTESSGPPTSPDPQPRQLA
jgi:hypothetical protein